MFHAQYGLQGCSATMCGLCHEAPAHSVTQSSRLSATRLTDTYLRGFSTHW
jgi:cytochrome c553